MKNPFKSTRKDIKFAEYEPKRYTHKSYNGYNDNHQPTTAFLIGLVLFGAILALSVIIFLYYSWDNLMKML